MSKKNRKRIEELEREVAYLNAMLRCYIALYEQGKSTTAPTIVPYPSYPLGTGTPLPDPPYRVTCTANGGRSTGVGYSTAVASEPVLSSAWLSLDDDKAWGDL